MGGVVVNSESISDIVRSYSLESGISMEDEKGLE